jgi:hypothetical protein
VLSARAERWLHGPHAFGPEQLDALKLYGRHIAEPHVELSVQGSEQNSLLLLSVTQQYAPAQNVSAP